MSIAPFLTGERLSNWVVNAITQKEYLGMFLLLNSPVFYTLYNNTFDINIFMFSYLFCGIFQGIINSGLYHVSDALFHGKSVNVTEWKATRFYENVIFNTDSVYLYIMGATVYTALSVVPDSLKWTFAPFQYSDSLIQLATLAVLHDILFTSIHFIIHKVPFLRAKHISYHHDCPFEVGSSRCTVASEGLEALIRDLYSSVLPAYIMSYCGMPFNAYLWLPYYTLYSFWAMYVHTGANKYHALHHTKNSNRNYGLYYLTDYVMGTLQLKDE